MGPANDGLRFLLEVGVLVALGYWGFGRSGGAMRWVVGLGLPLLVAVGWSVFVNPDGSQATSDPLRLVLELAVFGAAVAALTALRRRPLALTFALLMVVHLALTFPLDQR